VHGDYLDTRIKNTPDELARYDKHVNNLLDRIFDEYGLIVCGWSAEWDTALCGAIERCKGHRFTTYWATRGEPAEKAQQLIQLRRSQIIPIQNADKFFSELAEKVSALDEYSQPHPLSAKIAVARLKKYLVDDHDRIRLYDLVKQETEKLYGELSDEHFPVQGIQFNNNDEFIQELKNRVLRYEALTQILQSLFINGCYWGEQKYEYLWVKSLERIANPSGTRSGQGMFWLKLKRYPALLLVYAGGIAALAAEKYDTFAALLTKVRVVDIDGYFGFGEQPLVLLVYPDIIIDRDQAQLLPDMGSYTPINNHLFQVLREPLREFLPQDTHYRKCFDRFEYLLALVFADLHQKLLQTDEFSGPIGCFGWRYPRRSLDQIFLSEIGLEAGAVDQNWLPLKAGLFNGSAERYQTVKAGFDEWFKKVTWRR
jgi:hypothetical protein